jgi:ATP-binding cassette subfamily B protein
MFQMFISLLTLVVVSAALLYLNAPLALVVLSPMPLLAFAAWRFAAKVHPIFRSVQQKLADVTTAVQENVSGIRSSRASRASPSRRSSSGTGPRASSTRRWRRAGCGRSTYRG